MEHSVTKGSVNMTDQDNGLVDIFHGAAKVEIFGKLPSLLWAYIDTGRQLMEDLREHPPGFGSSMGRCPHTRHSRFCCQAPGK